MQTVQQTDVNTIIFHFIFSTSCLAFLHNKLAFTEGGSYYRHVETNVFDTVFIIKQEKYL